MSTTTVDCYVGVDVSKARLDLAAPHRRTLLVANDPEGIETLVGGLEEVDPSS